MWDIGVPGILLGLYDVVWNQKGRGEKGRRAREKKLDGKGGPFPKYYALGSSFFSTLVPPIEPALLPVCGLCG